MPVTDPIAQEPRRFSVRLPRPLWFGLATFVMVVAGVGFRFGTPIYRQQMAIREIERLGGFVGTVKGGPDWLRGWFDEERLDVFRQVASIDLAGTEFTDADAVNLSCFESLRELNLSGTKVTDAGLRRLKGSGVAELDLIGTQVTDAGLIHLRALLQLRYLSLAGTKVTRKAGRELKRDRPEIQIDIVSRLLTAHRAARVGG